jgi:lipooligosaccharide transport system permease protein
MTVETTSRPGVAARLARAVPIPAGAGLARMLIERNVRAYRRFWMAITTGFFEPVFYLFAMGIGLGRLIGEIDAGGGRLVDYALFVAPALLASSAMNGAVFDSTFNVFFKLRYEKLYDSVLATPLGPRDIAVGEISTALLRGLIYSIVFLGIAAAAGFVESWWALLAIPAASLIGFAFASVGMAVGTFMKTVRDLDYVQLAIMPMFLLSATFFPLSAYPDGAQWIVQISPLYNSVALVRALMLGDLHAGLLIHVAYLVIMGMAGVYFAALRVERLLLR